MALFFFLYFPLSAGGDCVTVPEAQCDPAMAHTPASSTAVHYLVCFIPTTTEGLKGMAENAS